MAKNAKVNNQIMKKHYILGCCGIDCGLCPRFYTDGDSKCPGCYGPDFENKHPLCGIASCCFKKNKLEVCSLCKNYYCVATALLKIEFINELLEYIKKNKELNIELIKDKINRYAEEEGVELKLDVIN